MSYWCTGPHRSFLPPNIGDKEVLFYIGRALHRITGKADPFLLPKKSYPPNYGQSKAVSFTEKELSAELRANQSCFFYRKRALRRITGKSKLFLLPKKSSPPNYGQSKAVSFTEKELFTELRVKQSRFFYRKRAQHRITGKAERFLLPKKSYPPNYGQSREVSFTEKELSTE